MADQTKLDEATRWFEKALKFEADGKTDKFINMALDKACKLEHEAFA